MHRRAQPHTHDYSCEPYSEPSAKKLHLPAHYQCRASIKKLVLQLSLSHITKSKFDTNSASAPHRTIKGGDKHSQLRILESSNTKKTILMPKLQLYFFLKKL